MSPAQLLREFVSLYCAVAEDPRQDYVGVPAFENAFWRFAASKQRGELTIPKDAKGRPWSPARALHRKWLQIEKLEHGDRTFYVIPVRWVRPTGQAERHEGVRAEPKVVAKLVAVERLDFVDTSVPVGSVVEQMHPGRHEQRYLEELYEREAKDFGARARPWLIVRIDGRRRCVRSSAFRREQS